MIKKFSMLARKIVEKKKKEETRFIENSISREGCLDNRLEEAMFYTNSLIRWDTEIKGNDGEGRGDGVW